YHIWLSILIRGNYTVLTDKEINDAKIGFKYQHPSDILHEHEDCIRMAYEWLDAQTTIKTKPKHSRALKHIIEKWAGRYISQSDVEIAAYLHPKITGKYPNFNLSAKFTRPLDSRLNGIGQAFTQDYRDRFDPKVYSKSE
ncbi:hypothetical protein, partial [Gluconobacter sp. P5H9_a]|uniref:hypothetical protein n=2 Tax=Gluconobacter sp. P5H9_a TaxID=2762616 RepID=UPI001C0453CC